MITHGSQIITDLRRGTWKITSMTRGTFAIFGKFATPYSVAATAALQTAFPTQWETIRDYGFAHPEIVPYVNQYPIGWGTFIASYVPLKWIKSTGEQILDTGATAGNANRIVMDMEFEDDYVFGGPFNSGVYGWGNTGLCLAQSYFYYGGYTQIDYDWEANKEYHVDAYWDGSQAHLYVNNAKIASRRNGNGVTSSLKVSFFAAYSSYPNITRYSNKLRIKHAEIYSSYNGNKTKEFYPCYRRSDGMAGMYDILTGTFEPNRGIGADFTKGQEGIFTPS